MSMCDNPGTCNFLNDLMPEMPSSVKIYQMLFCEDNFQTCARDLVRRELGSDFVPLDLFPHQLKRAEEIISKSVKH